jgi:large subunit ribosomal protein L18
MKKIEQKTLRQQRKLRVRKKIYGTAQRPRLAVFRSNKFIYAQIIDDVQGKTIVSAYGAKNINDAFEVGKAIAEKAKAKKIGQVIFDRGGYRYHGRVKSVAEGAREGGLNF